MVNVPPNCVEANVVAQLCVEYWKLAMATQRAIGSLPPKEGKRLEGQVKFSQRQLDVLLNEMGFRLVDLEGEDFNPGLATSVDNLVDYSEDEKLVVDKTIEPTIMSDMSIIRPGRITVAPAKHEKD